MAGAVAPGRVLVISEEGSSLWARRRDDLSIGNHAEFVIRPFKGRPTQNAWVEFVDYVAKLVSERRFVLVILDTLTTLLPVDNENDAARMIYALLPLHAITEVGAALLLVHHPRKGDAREGQASRGSGALPGLVDVILELRRFDPARPEDRRRTLTAYSRFDETPGEMVIELTDGGYRVVGSKAEALRSDRLAVIQ